LDAELARGGREKHPLSVLVMDLDGFKLVNDRFGHLEGNKMLRNVAMALKTACREYDYVARMGGDEFVVLLPGAKPADADARAAQFRQIVAQTCHTGLSSIGVSVGTAHFPQDGGSAEDLLALADRRMYQEKRQHKSGRTALETPQLWDGGVASTAIQ